MTKRILFLTKNLASGGAERQIVTVATMFADNGYAVEFLCYSEGDFYEHILVSKGIKVHWISLPNYIKRMLIVRKFIRNGEFDAVVSFLKTENFLNCFAAIGGKRWKVITGERSSSEKTTFHDIKQRIFNYFQRYSDALVCNSENAKQMWLRHYPQYADKLRIVYNTVALQPIPARYVPLQDGRLHIVVAASYQYIKNPIGVIKALLLMSEKERSRIKIDWYGRKKINEIKGDLAAIEAEQLIEQHSLCEVISLHEDTKEIHNRMYEADAVGLFSKYEGLPNAICEGMTLGKPILMSRVSDYGVLVDDSNGFLCDYDKPESIRKALIKMSILSIEQLKSMGECSRQKAENLFSMRKIFAEWNNVVFSD
ncbi:MAG: glycosyltransferase family 4 protein [Candidatus Egerieousia sp.]